MSVTQLSTNARLRMCAALLAGAVMWANASVAAPPGNIPFGVYDPNGAFTNDKQVVIEHLFLPWEDVSLESLYDADAYALERKREVLVTIEPWTWSRDARNTSQILINGIRTGEYDKNMLAICNILNDFKSPVTVRWAQEMDDASGQFIWANWEPSIYVNAFRRVIDTCRAVAPNVQVMWSPLGNKNLKGYYPGDDYVDVIGLSVFGLQAWEKATKGKELSFKEILEPRYNRVVGFGKPIVVAEVGYVGDEQYVAKWENSVRQNFEEFPELKGIVYFNQKEVHPWPDGYGLPDWQVSNRVVN
jgi:endoglucanase